MSGKLDAGHWTDFCYESIDHSDKWIKYDTTFDEKYSRLISLTQSGMYLGDEWLVPLLSVG